MMHRILSALAVGAIVTSAVVSGGCASTDGKEEVAESREKGGMVTGSMIPRRDRSSSPVQVLDPGAVQGSMNRGTPNTGKAPAGGS